MRTIKPLIIKPEHTLLAVNTLANRVPRLRPWLERHDMSCLIPTVNECWLAVGWDDGKGYKKMRWQGKAVYVHRFSFTLFNGQIPEGYVVDHNAEFCNSRSCCNPAHLRTMTVAQNTALGGAVLFGRHGKLTYTLEETFA